MPSMSITGTYLGARSAPYDFVDAQTGERRVGTSHRLHVYDFDACEITELTVSEKDVPATADLRPGQRLAFVVGVFARGNKTTFSFQSVSKVLGDTFALAAAKTA